MIKTATWHDAPLRDGFTIPGAMRHARWCAQRLFTDEGRRYSPRNYPHNTAPGGPADMIDDHRCRTITLQYGTRLGKTFFSQGTLLFHADLDPCPMMAAGETRDTVAKKYMHRVYKSVYKMKLANKLYHKSRRDHAATLMEFNQCQIVAAWAGSPGTLGDENIRVGCANELDKPGWDSKSTTKEGTPIKLFDERFKDFWSVRKVVYESTATVRGRSRIEARRIGGTNCKLHVRCPHCGKYQPLRFGERDEDGILIDPSPGRMHFERPEGKKKWNRSLARKTAHYVCESGECEPIEDHHRPSLMRSGVWVPDGCKVDDEKADKAAKTWYSDMLEDVQADHVQLWNGWADADWVEGEVPADEHASYQLSSLYALSLGWGDIADEYVGCIGKSGEMHNFINGWLADTVEIRANTTTWENLGDRIIADTPRGVIPSWASVLVAAVDRQQSFFPYGVFAYGPGHQHQCIEYGDVETLEELDNLVIQRTFQREDGLSPQMPMWTLIDDGFKPDSDVTNFCLKWIGKGHHVWPCKGSSRAQDAEFKVSVLGQNTASPGMHLYWVDTSRTQRWIEKVLYRTLPGTPGSGHIHDGSNVDHQDILEQLLNETSTFTEDSKGYEQESWIRVDKTIPNDYRDVWRYAYVAMLAVTRGAAIRPMKDLISAPEKQGARVISSGLPVAEKRW